jgi:hypothetical protein
MHDPASLLRIGKITRERHARDASICQVGPGALQFVHIASAERDPGALPPELSGQDKA